MPTTEATLSVNQLVVEARAAWDAYREQLTAFGANPASASLEPLLEVATPEVAAAHLENFEDAAARHVHTEGARTTTAFQISDASRPPASLVVDVCVDLSQERYVGDEGLDLTPTDRERVRSSTVTLTERVEGNGYIVAAEAPFSGPEESDPCV